MILMDRAPLYRRILTAPIRWHNRFESWLEDQDPSPFIRRADLLSQIGLVAIVLVLTAVVGIGSIHQIFKAR